MNQFLSRFSILSLRGYNNSEICVTKFLNLLGIAVDIPAVIEELDRHPDHPSLLAISDVLSNFDIENDAFRVTIGDMGALQSIACPFIAHTNINSGDFVVVHSVGADYLVVSSDKWNNHKITSDEFKKIFTWVVLTVAVNPETSTLKTTKRKLSNAIKYPATVAGLFTVLFLLLYFQASFFLDFNPWRFLLTIIETTGLATAILLLVQSINSNNPLIKKLCGTSKTDCNAILSSKAANVFDGLSWSEVGFFYFAGTWLIALFAGASPTTMRALLLLNVVSLPYTFYSIYYQAFIARQWCILCCTVQGLLWMEFIAVLNLSPLQSLSLPVDAKTASLCIVFLLLPVLCWTMLKPVLLKAQKVRSLTEQLRKFKYNTDLFNNLLNEQPKYAEPDPEWSIVIGNRDASNVITLVSNPYCPPCSTMHNLLEQLMDQNDDVQARILFTGSSVEKGQPKPVNNHFMALYKMDDKTVIKNALRDWYEQKQKLYETWATAYPIALDDNDIHKLEQQKAWCKMAGVNATPTVLVNGRVLPNIYDLPDLKYMLR